MGENERTSFPDVARWGAIVLGIIVAVPIVAILSNQAPFVLWTGLVVGFLAWAGIRSGVLAKDEEATTEADPLTTLQERYAAGELSEAEFERRLERILESDEQVQRAADGPAARAGRAGERREREAALERE